MKASHVILMLLMTALISAGVSVLVTSSSSETAENSQADEIRTMRSELNTLRNNLAANMAAPRIQPGAVQPLMPKPDLARIEKIDASMWQGNKKLAVQAPVHAGGSTQKTQV